MRETFGGLALKQLGSEIQRGFWGEHCVGGLCAGLELPLRTGVLGSVAARREARVPRGCTIPAQGKGVSASQRGQC